MIERMTDVERYAMYGLYFMLMTAAGALLGTIVNGWR